MPQDCFEKNPTAKFLFSRTPMNPWICFGEIFMYYDYEVHVFISMIFQKQCKHILDYLGTPLHWVFPSGDNQKWQQLPFNTGLLEPEVHVWREQRELRYGRHWCGQKPRTEWQLSSSYSSILACSLLTGFLFKTFFQGQWKYLLFSTIKHQGKCSLMKLLPYCTLSWAQDPSAFHSWFFILSPVSGISVTCIDESRAPKLM